MNLSKRVKMSSKKSGAAKNEKEEPVVVHCVRIKDTGIWLCNKIEVKKQVVNKCIENQWRKILKILTFFVFLFKVIDCMFRRS